LTEKIQPYPLHFVLGKLYECTILYRIIILKGLKEVIEFSTFDKLKKKFAVAYLVPASESNKHFTNG